MSGYVRAQRDRFSHHLFAKEKFCRGYAWDWMVAQARFTDCNVNIAGRTVLLQRGQFSHSIRFMAEAWNWDKAAVSRFVARLKTEAMIETDTETGQLIITICNYDEYQADVVNTETPSETRADTPARQQRDSSETKKNKGLREESSVAKATGADGAQPASFHEAIFRNGVAYLKRCGASDRSARSLLGKLKGTHGDEAVYLALAAAAKAGSPDPAAYIVAALKPKPAAVEMKTDQWGIPDAQPLRTEPRAPNIDAVSTAGAADLSGDVEEPETDPFLVGGPKLRVVG